MADVLKLRWPDDTWWQAPETLASGLVDVMALVADDYFTIRDPYAPVRDVRWGRHQFRNGLSGPWSWAAGVIAAQADPYNRHCQLHFGSGVVSVGEDCMYVTGDVAAWKLRSSAGVSVAECAEDPWLPPAEDVEFYRGLPDVDAGLWEELISRVARGHAPLVLLDWAGPLGGYDWFRISESEDVEWLRREVRERDCLFVSEAEGEWIADHRDARLRDRDGGVREVLVAAPGGTRRGQPAEFWPLGEYGSGAEALADARNGVGPWLCLEGGFRDTGWRVGGTNTHSMPGCS